MTSKLKCPYSEEELKEIRNNFKGDKLVCPFCQQELIREGMNHWWCSCNINHQGKELYGTTALWQALIRRTNQLNIAITDIHHAYKSLMGGCAEWRLYLEQTLKQIQDLDNDK